MWSFICMAESVFHKIRYFTCEKCLKSSVKACLQDQFRQTWHAHIDTGSKTLNYRLFRNEIEFENYFNILMVEIYLLFVALDCCPLLIMGRWK